MRKNVYTCELCSGHIVTVDREKGVTPFLIACRVNPHDAKLLTNEDNLSLPELQKLDKTRKCRGEMHSAFYRVRPDCPPATWEWYRPTGDDYTRLSEFTRRDHVDKGGLLLRPIKEAAESNPALGRQEGQ